MNSCRDMPWLTRRYSGVRWYFSNSSCQCDSVSGGMAPMSGLPLDDGQPRAREPRHAAHHDHGKHQGTADQQPGRHRPACTAVGRAALPPPRYKNGLRAWCALYSSRPRGCIPDPGERRPSVECQPFEPEA